MWLGLQPFAKTQAGISAHAVCIWKSKGFDLGLLDRPLINQVYGLSHSDQKTGGISSSLVHWGGRIPLLGLSLSIDEVTVVREEAFLWLVGSMKGAAC